MTVKIRHHRGNVVLRIDHNQQRRQIKIGPDNEKNRAKAEKKKQEWEAALRMYGEEALRGPDARESCPTFKEYSSEWLKHARLKQATLQSYRTNLNKHLVPAFGSFRLDEITVRAVRKFLHTKSEETYPVHKAKKLKKSQEQSYRHYSRDALRLMRATLQTIFEDAVLDGYVTVNPAASRKLSKSYADSPTKGEKRPFSRAELYAFEDKVRARYPEYYELVLVMGRAGLRIGEALALEWGDIDFKAGRIHVTKNLSPGRGLTTPKSKRSRRQVVMSTGLADALKELRARQLAHWLEAGQPAPDRLFHNTAAGRLLYPKFRERFQKLQAGGLLRTPHDLRHTFASLHLQSGTPVELVSEQMGHANVAITYRIYAHWIPDAKFERDQADKLDREPDTDPQQSATFSRGKGKNARK